MHFVCAVSRHMQGIWKDIHEYVRCEAVCKKETERMFFSLKFTKKSFIVLCTCFLVGLAAGGFGIHKAVTAVQANQEVSAGIKLPIIMYHGVLKDTSRQGKYVISPELLESDMKYLQENGYTPVFMQDVIDYVLKGEPLPEKPIVLSFDDGYYNNYAYAYPLAQQYHTKIVIAPIVVYTEKYSELKEENANYGHITWDNMKEMADSGYVEIQNHTYNLHASNKERKGIKKLKGESESHYEKLITEDLQTAQNKIKEHLGKEPNTFVYPFGAASKTSEEYIRKLGFQATLTCTSRMNTLTQDPECLYGLGRYLRTNESDSKTFFSKILE